MSESETDGLAPGWDAFWDEGEQSYYYHNDETGETTWDKPTAGETGGEHAEATEAADSADADVDATAATPTAVERWIAHKAEDGDTYYYNETTQETTWDKPEGVEIISAEDVEEDDDDDDDNDGDAPAEGEQPTKTPAANAEGQGDDQELSLIHI